MVFTPHDIVKRMLDILKYTNNLYGKKILENSCGDGHFLVEIVTRYVEDCRRNGYNDTDICTGLERDIYGFEIDEVIYKTCLRNLNNLLNMYSLPQINWNVKQADTLKIELGSIFTYVIGNPPYITYSALSAENRKYIKDTFTVCKEGKPDYYYAFIESAIKCMNNNGRLVYLVPSNFFKTRFANELRQYMQHTLVEIYDYTEQKIFDTALTSSAIVVCDNSKTITEVNYHDIVNDALLHIRKEDLATRWIFRMSKLSKENASQTVRFGDLFTASSSIATLYNKAYIIKPDSDEYKFIEKEVIRVAVSPKSHASKKVEYIIFPYYYDEKGILQRYPEGLFRDRFPHAVEHLERYREQLAVRDSDKSACWFEYGRSQAIAHLNQRKLLLSTLVTDRIKVYELDKQTIPYSGIYIIAKSGSDLSDAKKILESVDFFNYAKKVGIHANGTSIRISIHDINNYRFYKIF